MMRFVQTVLLAPLLVGLAPAIYAQQTGPQQLAFAGLRTVPSVGIPQGQINAIQTDAQGDLYLLIDQKDGVRLLKTDPTATNILAQAQLGAKGDIGLALALDPVGNVYVTGTTTSGALTATAGAAFLTPSGTAINSFVAKFDPNLNTYFVTFTGGASIDSTAIAATSDAVFITGSIFATTLPVTPSAIIQTPAFGSTSGNGFVEKFSSTGSTLLYATYLSGASGNTTPAALAADTSDDAYIAGTTTAPGYPTIAALIPAMLDTTSGFLTKLTPAGDGITFSTYIPGFGITSIALDPTANNLLLSGSIALGQFPVASVQSPLTATAYQTLLRISLDGSTVLASTLLAPGTQSFVAPGLNNTAWVDGALTLPLLPLTPLANIGNSFAVRVNSANLIDQTARFGGIAAANPGNAGAPINLTSLAVNPSGNALPAGSFTPYASSSLLSTQTFDLPLINAPTPAFPSTVHDAVLPASACNGSLCPGSAAFLAKLTIPTSTATASLALSIDDSPNLTLRNFGSAQATGLQISLTGFTSATNCTPTLASGGECSIALTGTGPGSITAQATNATPQTQTLPAITTTPTPIVFSPKELDFGIVSSASAPTTRTITVTNLTQQSQTFASALNIPSKTTLPYTIAEQSSDCTLAGQGTKLLAPGGVCHITLALTASSSSTNDGLIQQSWLIGARGVQLTAYAQAAALSLSAPEIDFGTQYPTTPQTPRYLYLSNNSTVAILHTAVTLPGSSPFSVTDRCPSTLEPLTVCQLQLAYQSSRTPSADAATLTLDQGLTALVTGRTLPQPAANGASVNPNLSISAIALNFPTPVVVTGISSGIQTLTLQNTGASAFTLSLTLTGDFTGTTNCTATLPGGATCSILFTFVPSQPGTRQGLLAVTAGAGTTPAYITLSGVGTGILTPITNGAIAFSLVITGQFSIQWIKVSQPFTTLAAATASTSTGTPYTAILVEDIGYGHGDPPSSAFSANPTGTCINCWLGVRFIPTATGLETGTLALTSTPSGNPYVLTLTGAGLPLAGLLLTPVTQDFGPVPINSVSGPSLFTLTNLTTAQTAVALTTPTLAGDFTLSSAPTGGAPCTGSLAYSASCYLQIAFAPTALGQRTGSLTLQSGSLTATSTLTGYGSPDPGLALNPTALVFSSVPGNTSTQQTITLTNTGTSPLQIATPIVNTTSSPATSFTQTTTCTTLAPTATCTITVTFLPSTAPSAGTLYLPVTSTLGGSPILTTYTVPLTGAYTTEDAGLELLSADTQYGPQTTGATGIIRQFTLDNLTTKSLTLNIALPRQFILSGPPCTMLAPSATCNFSVAFLPLTNGDITGTLFAQATPTDNSAPLNGLTYVEGYGVGPATLTITGNLQPGNVLNFGQVLSGQSATKVLTLTNTSTTLPLTIRRLTSEWPFLATTTCGATLTPSQSCTVTLAYTPLNQVATGTSSPQPLTDSGTLILESDGNSSPDLIDLIGTSTPASVSSPSNTAPLAAFTASQSSLTFATTMAGNISPAQTVTLSNTGSATVHILGLQTTPDFTVSSNCGNLLPASICTLTVTFTPQVSTVAARISALEIATDASTPLEFISLLGTATPSTLGISPANLTFGTVLAGSSGTLPLQLSNTATTPTTFGILSATGDYTAAAGSCPLPGLTLAPGTSCTAQITFVPTQSGIRTGTFSVASSASTLPLTAALTGTGAQSHLQVSPSTLNFGPIAVGAPAVQSFTLTNTGTVPTANITTDIAAPDYAVTIPCVVTTLPVGGSCSVSVTFTPIAIGARPGSLVVTSSDPSSPDTIPLTGTGVANGTFTLTVNSSTSASATVTSGSPASYTLTVVPLNNFSGAVALTCNPIVPAQYATCSLLPSSITLNGTPQNSVATLNTVTSIAANDLPATPRRGFGDTALGLFFPALFLTWKARTSRHRAWRRIGPLARAFFATLALLSSSGCGGSSSPSVSNSNLRYSPPGSYQYQVTASSISGTTQITQTATLNLTVQ